VTDFTTRIRTLREERGQTQEEVARRAGLTLKHIGDIERGRIKDPHYSTLSGIARALDTTVADLMGEGRKGKAS
jgi:transcriptional regulator with XRE-family HTH domain